MIKKFPRITLLIIATLLTGLAFAWPALAQTVTPPPPREALIQSIQARAQNDMKLGKQPETVEALKILFGEDAASVGMPMTEVVTIYETAYQTAKQTRSPWEDLKGLLSPNAAWLAAILMGVLLILGNVIKEYIASFFKRLFEAAYQQLAGYRLFWGVALRRYRKTLEINYQELKIPFRLNRPLKMQEVYVPLRAAGSTSQESVDAYEQIKKYNRLVVVGTPGAGKSMLLRHVALTYARRGLKDFPHQPVPILLELNRLNDSNTHLLDQLAGVLERCDFPRGGGFVEAFLKKGRLLILLDGLDEVNTQARARVVSQIKDLLHKSNDGRENQIIITCRIQVYQNEFGDWANQKLEIVDFNDQQTQRFLVAWAPDMLQTEGKSVEHLVHTLQERPQIMTLARNPLLLTMIAYLYTDTAFVLPHSRAEFYDRSTTLLLDQWDQWRLRRNQYKAIQKRLVLQSLALFNHSGQAGGDRRSIEVSQVLDQIRIVLPTLTLKDDDAQPMLDEIVERSGLLLAVDGGARYQFTHLTLQEFFAAQTLKDKPDTLLNLFMAERDVWREVVRLWCGLEHDCTDLLQRIFDADYLLAIECLADAQQVNRAYADRLINRCTSHLTEVAKNEPLARALALVAADPRQRGTALLEYLIASLARPRYQSVSLAQPQLRLSVATILSLTNLPKAAEALAKYADTEDDLRPFLIQMGDLAVPALSHWAKRGKDWALNALHKIGTPIAALALAPLLWEDRLSYKVAWRLAAMLQGPNVETLLRSFELTSEQRKAEYLDWVWEPFDEPADSSLPVIAGRVAHLLRTTPRNLIPSDSPSLTFDPRLVIPLCAIPKGGINEDLPQWGRLIAGLPNDLRQQVSQLRRESTPDQDDWREVFRPAKYVFETSCGPQRHCRQHDE